MANVIGRGVRLEIGLTNGTPKTVTAVTLAATGVATSTAHGMANGTVGAWSGVTGMVQLDGQATRVYNQAANTFDLQGLNTTSYSAFTAGTFTPVATWATLAAATSYAVGGGEANKLNATRLIDVITQEENGLLAPQTISINLLSEDVNSQALQLIEDAALAQGYLVFRLTLSNGAVRVFRGSPSLPNEDVQQGALGTGAISITVKGVVLKGAA
jgi:hypothetical protein